MTFKLPELASAKPLATTPGPVKLSVAPPATLAAPWLMFVENSVAVPVTFVAPVPLIEATACVPALTLNVPLLAMAAAVPLADPPLDST